MGKKKYDHIKFLNGCVIRGVGMKMPNNGLCNCAKDGHIDPKLFKLLTPTVWNMKKIAAHGASTVFWAEDNWWDPANKLGTLRTTIVLFMAAMNNEL